MTKQLPLNYDPFKFIEKQYLNQRKAHTQGGAAFDEALAKSMTNLGNAYRNGKNPELTDHLDHLAYLIQYAPIGMAVVQRLVWVLRSKVLPPQFSILSDEPLRSVSIGAGPGTDLFGFLMALAASPPNGISFSRMDIDKRWRVYYEGFLADFRKQVPQFGPTLEGIRERQRFVKINFEDDWLNGEQCRQVIGDADIVILNRVLSLFQDDAQLVARHIRSIAKRSPADSLVVMIDVTKSKNTLANALALCRLEKPKSEWVKKPMPMHISNFGWQIPNSIKALEKRHDCKINITRSGRFFGGALWLKK